MCKQGGNPLLEICSACSAAVESGLASCALLRFPDAAVAAHRQVPAALCLRVRVGVLLERRRRLPEALGVAGRGRRLQGRVGEEHPRAGPELLSHEKSGSGRLSKKRAGSQRGE